MEISETPNNSVFELGKEFAFEGMDPSSFIGHTASEYREFKKGYEEGIKIMRERYLAFDKTTEEPDKSGGKKI